MTFFHFETTVLTACQQLPHSFKPRKFQVGQTATTKPITTSLINVNVCQCDRLKHMKTKRKKQVLKYLKIFDSEAKLEPPQVSCFFFFSCFLHLPQTQLGNLSGFEVSNSPLLLCSCLMQVLGHIM